ncbi:unnamed protein product [Oppiella nova]|uniref:Uncharacterized protein n=1 Tax=Oppiella nova TaxID=334625 RepID=A0A7R9MF74_9ACAR|nr:unnamed protein product [Oppiella nova]CAG2176271.1 unnamed protein product [Oppiella nova]
MTLECDTKDTAFITKFKNLKKEDNQVHLYGACKELDLSCRVKFNQKVHEESIKQIKSLNDCYSKMAKCGDEYNKLYEKISEKLFHDCYSRVFGAR